MYNSEMQQRSISFSPNDRFHAERNRRLLLQAGRTLGRRNVAVVRHGGSEIVKVLFHLARLRNVLEPRNSGIRGREGF